MSDTLNILAQLLNKLEQTGPTPTCKEETYLLSDCIEETRLKLQRFSPEMVLDLEKAVYFPESQWASVKKVLLDPIAEVLTRKENVDFIRETVKDLDYAGFNKLPLEMRNLLDQIHDGLADEMNKRTLRSWTLAMFKDRCYEMEKKRAENPRFEEAVNIAVGINWTPDRIRDLAHKATDCRAAFHKEPNVVEICNWVLLQTMAGNEKRDTHMSMLMANIAGWLATIKATHSR